MIKNFLELHNEIRPGYTLSQRGVQLAMAHSATMARNRILDHNNAGDGPFKQRLAGVGRIYGENIGMGYRDAQAMMDAWMGSAGHRANIMNLRYTGLGYGSVQDYKGVWYHTCIYIG